MYIGRWSRGCLTPQIAGTKPFSLSGLYEEPPGPLEHTLLDLQDHQNHLQDHQNHPQEHQNHLQDPPNYHLISSTPLGGLLMCVVLMVLEVILVFLGVVLVVQEVILLVLQV